VTTTPAAAATPVIDFQKQVSDSQASVKNAARDLEFKLGSDTQYQKLEAAVVNTEKKMTLARQSGTIEDRMSASSAFNNARRLRNEYRAKFINADATLPQAKRQLAVAEKAAEDFAREQAARATAAQQAAAEAAITPRERAKREAQTVTATQLVRLYSQNEVKGDEHVKDRYVKVSGVVSKVGKDILDSAYVTLKTDDEAEFREVQCTFDSTAGLSSLKPGQKLVVFGKCVGLMMNVQFTDCEVMSN
jgi:hypothetical protein